MSIIVYEDGFTLICDWVLRIKPTTISKPRLDLTDTLCSPDFPELHCVKFFVFKSLCEGTKCSSLNRMTRTSTQRTLSPQPAHPGVAANASNSAINVHESYTRTHTTDNGEPPVREKLKKTSITAESHTPGSGVVAEMGVPGAATASTTAVTNLDVKSTKDISEEERGRLSRKRSFDDVEVDEQEVKLSEKPIGGEKKDSRARKRSKDSKDDRSDDGYDCEKDRSESLLTKETTSGTVEDALGDPGESLAKSEPYGASGRDGQRAAETSKNIHHQKRRASWPELVDAGSDRKVVSKEKHITPPLQEDNKQEDDLKETIGSPKNKRTRDEFTKDEDIAHVDEGITDSKDEPFDAGKVKNGDEPKSKRHRDSSSPQPEEESVEKKPPVATATVSSRLIMYINSILISFSRPN